MAEPILRFRRDDGGSYPSWKEMSLGTLVSDNMDPVPTPKDGYRRVGIYCHAKGTFQEDVPAENVLDVDTMYRIHRDNLIVNITFAWEHAVAIVKPEDEGLLVSHRFPEYSFNDGQVPSFYKYLVLRPYFRNQLSLASPGGAGRNRVLNKAQFKKIHVTVPCEEEQQKIADFLSSVDEVITASEEEVANLEMQKKAVMKKIFSQEVRFKRTDGSDFPEWEGKTLGDLAEFSKGQGYTKSDLSETGNQIILYGRLYTKYQTVISEVDTFAEMKPRSVLSKKGDVIVPASGETAEDISVAAVVDVDGIILGGDLNIIHPCDAILPDYLAYALTFGTPHQEMTKRAQGKSIVHLHNDDLKSAAIVYPCLEQQRLIADFLSDFDEAIAAAKKELELWKELKKGLLQKMFV